MSCCKDQKPTEIKVDFCCEKENVRFYRTLTVLPSAGHYVRYGYNLFRVLRIIHNMGDAYHNEAESVEIDLELAPSDS